MKNKEPILFTPKKMKNFAYALIIKVWMILLACSEELWWDIYILNSLNISFEF